MKRVFLSFFLISLLLFSTVGSSFAHYDVGTKVGTDRPYISSIELVQDWDDGFIGPKDAEICVTQIYTHTNAHSRKSLDVPVEVNGQKTIQKETYYAVKIDCEPDVDFDTIKKSGSSHVYPYVLVGERSTQSPGGGLSNQIPFDFPVEDHVECLDYSDWRVSVKITEHSNDALVIVVTIIEKILEEGKSISSVLKKYGGDLDPDVQAVISAATSVVEITTEILKAIDLDKTIARVVVDTAATNPPSSIGDNTYQSKNAAALVHLKIIKDDSEKQCPATSDANTGTDSSQTEKQSKLEYDDNHPLSKDKRVASLKWDEIKTAALLIDDISYETVEPISESDSTPARDPLELRTSLRQSIDEISKILIKYEFEELSMSKQPLSVIDDIRLEIELAQISSAESIELDDTESFDQSLSEYKKIHTNMLELIHPEFNHETKDVMSSTGSDNLQYHLDDGFVQKVSLDATSKSVKVNADISNAQILYLHIPHESLDDYNLEPKLIVVASDQNNNNLDTLQYFSEKDRIFAIDLDENVTEINVMFTEFVVPSWVKNNAGWWAEGSIDDASFVQGIQFLIEEGIMTIPPTIQGTTSNDIPDWVKNNAGWWAEGSIDDASFVQGIQFLIEEGIMTLVSDDNSTAPDSDMDGIPDNLDSCPLEQETYNNFTDDDGCPDISQ